MQIICPECKFAREVDENKIPARSQVATCPKCQTKFKFRELPEQEFLIEESDTPEPEPTAAPEPEPAAPPASDQEPVLKPFVQKVPPQPEPNIESFTTPEEQKPTFPGIPGPAADDDGGLWDRLHTMTPPETEQNPEAEQGTTDERKPPIIGSRYGQSDAPTENQQPVPGWTGEFNEDFPDPMGVEDEEGDELDDGYGVQVPPPFEQLDRYGFFSGLFLTVKLVLFSPRLFFSVMPVGNGVAKPLTFAILAAMIQALAQLAWGMADLSIMVEPSGTGPAIVHYDLSTGIFSLLFTPAVIAISLYILTGFYHLVLMILKGGDQGFEGTFRAIAYANAPIIIGLFPMPTLEIYTGWMFLYATWSLALTAIGFKHIHKTSYLKAIPTLFMPLVIIVIFTLLALQGQLPTV